MATTFAAIRQRYCGSIAVRGLIEDIVPRLSTDKPFMRSLVRNKPLRTWATGKNSSEFRKFEWLRTGEAEEPEVLADPMLRNEQATLTIAYPVQLGLYGPDDQDSMEDLIRSDAHQVRDVLLSGGNLLTDCIAVLPTIVEPERGEAVWFQPIVCKLIYFESQTLT
jgi:hypothetical protein